MIGQTLIQLGVLTIKLHTDIKVHVSPVSRVGPDGEGSLHLLPGIDRQVIPDVKHRLLPVSVRTFGGCERKGEGKTVQDQAGIPKQEKYQFFSTKIGKSYAHHTR